MLKPMVLLVSVNLQFNLENCINELLTIIDKMYVLHSRIILEKKPQAAIPVFAKSLSLQFFRFCYTLLTYVRELIAFILYPHREI